MYHRGHLFYFSFKGTCKLFPDFKNFLRDPIWVLLKHFCRSLHLPRCSVREKVLSSLVIAPSSMSIS